MPQKSIKCNPRIEITAEQTWFVQSHEEQMRELQTMIPDIIRHIDGIDRHGNNIEVKEDIKKVCEFCGYAWTEESDMFNGGCCDKDLEYESCINVNEK